jgi:hypothetical protein
MGSRYGGLKQLDPVGPSGETILDYAVYDADPARASAGSMFVIRRDFEEAFRDAGGRQVRGSASRSTSPSRRSTALPAGFTPPAGREKPWGTGHAVWCAREVHQGSPSPSIGADDFLRAGRVSCNWPAFLERAPVARPRRCERPSRWWATVLRPHAVRAWQQWRAACARWERMRTCVGVVENTGIDCAQTSDRARSSLRRRDRLDELLRRSRPALFACARSSNSRPS